MNPVRPVRVYNCILQDKESEYYSEKVLMGRKEV